jgi:hypothetical protein
MALSDLSRGCCEIENRIGLPLHPLISNRARLLPLQSFEIRNAQEPALVQVLHVGAGLLQGQEPMVSTGLAEKFVRDLSH